MLTPSKNIVSRILAAFLWMNASGQVNPGFENGLTGWKIIGNKASISIDYQNAYEGKACARIGPGHGGLEQRIETLPLSIVQYSIQIKSDLSRVRGYSFIRFFDSAGKLLLEYKSDPVSSSAYQQSASYTESPPGTRYSTIGFYNDSSGLGYIYADGFSADLHPGISLKTQPPICNLDQYLKPFWKPGIVYNETVLLYSSNGSPGVGRLLYTPTEILSVKNYSLDQNYLAEKDYTVKDNTMIRTPHSSMPFRADTSFDRKTDLAWFNLQSQWVVVTYRHKEAWNEAMPPYKGASLPLTMAKLNSKSPLKIVAFGMSITRGMDESGFDTIPPYMPNYLELFAYQIRKKFRYRDITLFNAGLPGATVDWAAKYAEIYINPLKPDLVILDFGMNDFWRLSPEQFIGHIQIIMNKIRAGNPKVEFLLISNMLFDPDYILDSDKYKAWYLANLKGYNLKLQELERPGVVDLDMTTLSDRIYQRKKAKDCIVNPLHPNDYLARWYAQTMYALFDH